MLVEDFASAPPELVSFTQLLAVLGKSKPSMKGFVSQIVDQITRGDRDIDLPYVEVAETFLVGRGTLRGVSTKRTTAIFLDLDSPPAQARPVAHQVTCELINAHLLQVRPGRGYAKGGKGAQKRKGLDAFTGTLNEFETSFPEPKVQVLRPPILKLFSANSETGCLGRYGLIDSDVFPVSKESAARMQNAIKYLAGAEEQRGKTWYPIPSNLTEKKRPKADLLVAYLENEPDSRAAIAEMFGGQCETFSDADFEARTQPVFAAIEAKLKTMPDLNVRLLILSSLDPGRKQLGLARRFRVTDVIRAAKDWQTGARNAPTVSVEFHDKVSKQFMFRGLTTPCPLELASTINRVWSSDAKDGFKSSFQRVFSASDAYDIFLADASLARQKAEAALGLLIQRMSVVLAGLGVVKTTREWTRLSDAVRWQSLKTIALLGILLRQLGHHREDFMQKTITQFGRLLALADSLHLQYCKHVRKGESPSQLIGNALFSTALEQPVFALARLAERLTPYQAWARTFQSDDPNAGVGLIKYFLGEIAACTSAIHLEQLPDRMLDADKAKLLLGYLADHSKNDMPIQ